MLVLPLTVPVLIFGVAASNAAIVGPLPFGTPFTILCALTLVSLVVGIICRGRGAAAGNGVTRWLVSLRHIAHRSDAAQ